jgi:hypothetical protein
MPTQSSSVSRLYTYGQYDTGPPLDYQLKDRQGNIVDLTDAQAVFFEMGWTSFDHYWNPTQAKVKNGPCVIDPNGLGLDQGWVRYPWQPGDLDANGTFDFIFRVKFNDGTVQTIRSLAYDHVSVQIGPYAQFEELP